MRYTSVTTINIFPKLLLLETGYLNTNSYCDVIPQAIDKGFLWTNIWCFLQIDIPRKMLQKLQNTASCLIISEFI